MTTAPERDGAATHERAISENIHTLLYRARMTQRALAQALGMSHATLSRKIAGVGSWSYAEVRSIADYLGVTMDEIAEGLPSFDEWQARWVDLCACRDSNPKPSDMYPARLLRLLPTVKPSLTPNRLTLAHPPVVLRSVS